MDQHDENDPIHVLLHEHAGGETPPDLRAVVAARFAAGDAASVAEQLQGAEAAPAGQQRLLAAAVLLCGAAVVGGTAWLQREPAVEPAPATSVATDQDPVPGGELHLRVLDIHGGPVQSFELEVLHVGGAGPHANYVRVAGMPPRQVAPRDFVGDCLTIADLVAGNYVVVVRALGHVPTCSEPFRLGDPGTRLTVRLNTGGELLGLVQGPDGKPLEGVTVRTTAPPPPGIAGNSGLVQALAQSVVRLQTETTARTAADGAWQVSRLTCGRYRVVFEHPEFCAGAVTVDVDAGKHHVPAVKLQRGARVRGRAVADGQVVARVDITLRADSREPDAQMWRARSDADGVFVMPARIPPGRYVIQGMRSGPGNNPLQMMTDATKSERVLEVREAQDSVEVDVLLGGS